MLKIEGRIEARYVAKAKGVLEDYLAGNVHPKKTYGKKYQVLEVGKSHRLLNRKGEWSLMTHSKYNRIVDSRK